MSVYKPTYCHPYLTAVDAESVLVSSGDDCVWLTCKIDSSNKPIYGYRVILLDSNNVRIFPQKDIADTDIKISPISDAWIVTGDTNTNGDVASGGLNGDTLKIPFIQSDGSWIPSGQRAAIEKKNDSYNAIYAHSFSDNTLKCKYYETTSLTADATINYYIKGTTYKWQIILYQGIADNVEKGSNGQSVTTTSSQPYPHYMDYSVDGFSDQNYDMVLTNGTILGSTNKRLQISSGNGTGDIPESSVVLLGRYMQLYNASHQQQGSARGYVESYDSTYGHVYPTSAWTSKNAQSIIDESTYVSFFKYSNDPDYVKTSEEVDVAVNGNVDERVLQTGGSISVLSNGTSVGWPIVEGTLILLMGQTNPQENGVYIAHMSTAWTRSGSYDSWSEMIGKIIFAQNGTLGGKNFQSQAYAGGTLLDSFDKLYTAPHEFTYILDTTILDEDDVAAYLTNNYPDYIPAAGDYIMINKVQTLGTNDGTTDATFNKYNNKYPIYLYNSVSGTLKWTASSMTLYSTVNSTSQTGRVAYRIKVTKGVPDNAVYTPLIATEGSLPTAVGGVVQFQSDLDAAISQYSKLRFSDEPPIVLYPSLLEYTVAAICTPTAMPTEGKASGQSFTDDCDGFDPLTFVTGNLIYYSYVKNSISYYQILSILVSDGVATVNDVKFDKPLSDLTSPIYVQRGVTYGLSAWKNLGYRNTAASGATAVWELKGDRDFSTTSAYILRNSLTETYVTPFTGLLPDMRLGFISPQVQVHWSDADRVYLPVLSIDTKLWKITHPSLSVAIPSSAQVGDAAFSYIPYKYSVTSFFQSSDENPYWSYTYPSLIVYDMNEEDKTTIDTSLQTTDAAGHPIWSGSEDVTETVLSRKLYIKAVYRQDQKGSWESYRWWLTDAATKETLQDTGIKYDQQIATTFFGLSSSTQTETHTYYIVHLVLTDSIGNSLSWSQTFYSQRDASIQMKAVSFTATLNKQLQCIDLDYSDTGLVYPTLSSNNKDLRYTEDNSLLGSLYDDSLIYNNNTEEENSFVVLGTKDILLRPTNGDFAVKAPVHLWNVSDIARGDPYYVSVPVEFGFTYKHYLGLNGYSVSDSDSLLQLVTDGSNNYAEDTDTEKLNPSDSVAFRTKIQLTGDSCGPMFTMGLTKDSSVDTSKPLSVSLTLPDNIQTDDGSSIVLAADRMKVNASVSIDGGTPYSVSGFPFFTEALPLKHRYYLQLTTYKESDNTGAEYLHYQSMGLSSTTYGTPYYERGSLGAGATDIAYSYLDPVGNLLLISDAENSANIAKETCCFLSGVGIYTLGYPDFYFNSSALAQECLPGCHGINHGKPRTNGYAVLPCTTGSLDDLKTYWLNLYPNAERTGFLVPNGITKMSAHVRHPDSLFVSKALYVVITGRNIRNINATLLDTSGNCSYDSSTQTYTFGDNASYLKIYLTLEE